MQIRIHGINRFSISAWRKARHRLDKYIKTTYTVFHFRKEYKTWGQGRRKDYDVRRYAYWSVFAGSFGHTYGHNSIMQFIKPGVGGAYGAKKPWYDALNDPATIR